MTVMELVTPGIDFKSCVVELKRRNNDDDDDGNDDDNGDNNGDNIDDDRNDDDDNAFINRYRVDHTVPTSSLD